MDNNEELLKLLLAKEEEPANIKEFLYKLLAYWKWFALSALISVGMAYFITKYSLPEYKIKSSLIITENSNDGISLENLFSGTGLQQKNQLNNHIAILESYTLNNQVLKNLGWYNSWFQANPLGDIDLYSREPYRIEFDHQNFNLCGVPLTITPVDNEHYKVQVDTKTSISGTPTVVQFANTAEYGKPFTNAYFNFTLFKGNSTNHNEVYFVFNDLNRLTLSNQKQVSMSLGAKDADVIIMESTGQNPQRRIDYLNEMAKAYQEYQLKQKNQIADNTIHFIDQQLQGIVDTLQQNTDEFTEYRRNNRVFDLASEAEVVTNKLATLDGQRSMSQMQLDYYKNLQNYLNNEDGTQEIVFPSVVGITDVGLNNMVVRLGELNSKKEILSASASDKIPTIQLLDKEINYIQKSLRENVKNLIFNTQTELKAINEEIADVNQQLSRYPKKEQELINIKRMVDLNNELYTFLLQKRAEAAITTASNVPDAQVLDEARIDTAVQVGPKKSLNLMIGLVLGLALPFLIIVLKDFFNDTIQTKDEIEKKTKLPLVAEIAHNRYDAEMPVVNHPRSGISESFRSLRINLQYMLNNQDKGNVIAVHSMIPGEGKTFNSLNLASIIALDNKKVLLIGCDLRKPRLHQIFNTSNDNGLSTYLIGKHKLDDIVCQASMNNMQYINSGPIPPNPSELISNGMFNQLLEEAKLRYDYIILDNAPISLVTDGFLIGKYAAVNLMVMRQNFSKKDQIHFINQLAKKNSLSNMGIVLNDTINKGYYSSYGTYGNYGYYDDSEDSSNWFGRLIKSKNTK